MVLITSRANSQIKAIRALRSRRERERTGVFFAEGGRVVAEALKAEADIETLVIASARLSEAERLLVDEAARGGAPVLEISPEVFDSLSFRGEPQAVGAVVRRRRDVLPEAALGERCWVAVHEVQHPGNLGTLIRTCDAAGGAGVILTGPSTDPYHPVAVRGSLGAIFSQKLIETTPEAFASWTRRYHCTVVGTSPAGEVDYREAEYSTPVVLLMGSERVGLSPDQAALCHQVVRIPMAGVVDSLNLSVAAALVLYEVYRKTAAIR